MENRGFVGVDIRHVSSAFPGINGQVLPILWASREALSAADVLYGKFDLMSHVQVMISIYRVKH